MSADGGSSEVQLQYKNFKPVQPNRTSNVTQQPKQPSSEEHKHSQYLKALILDLPNTYSKCCPAGVVYTEELTARRCLTKNGKGAHNHGYDNSHHDYICHVADAIANPDGDTYEIVEKLGSGTFGQVIKVKCRFGQRSGQCMAMKIVKNKPSYYKQALLEVGILQTLNQDHDPNDDKCIVRMLEFFVYRHHVCVVFELLTVNLYDVLKQNNFKGVSAPLVRVLTRQLVKAIECIRQANIIHADIKPENVLLCDMKKTNIKLIDFGSSCFENHIPYQYIQSRFYRAPEIILRHPLPYTAAIDIWSLGCVCAELWLGLPVFAGQSEYDQMRRFVKSLGMPPASMLEKGRATERYFCCKDTETPDRGEVWRLQSRKEYEKTSGRHEQTPQEYLHLQEFPHTFESIINKGGGNKDEKKSFGQFLAATWEYDPVNRWTPAQLAQHTFVTCQPFCPDISPPNDANDGDTSPSFSWLSWDPYGGQDQDIAGEDTPKMNDHLTSFCLNFKPPARTKALSAIEELQGDTVEDGALVQGCPDVSSPEPCTLETKTAVNGEAAAKGNFNDSHSTASGDVTMPPPPARLKRQHSVEVNSLIKIGFTVEAAKQAIDANDGDFMRAMEALVKSAPADKQEDTEPSKQELTTALGKLVAMGFEPTMALECLLTHLCDVQSAVEALQKSSATSPENTSAESYRPELPTPLKRSFSAPSARSAKSIPQVTPLQRSSTEGAKPAGCK